MIGEHNYILVFCAKVCIIGALPITLHRLKSVITHQFSIFQNDEQKDLFKIFRTHSGF